MVRSIAACGDAAKFAFNMDGPGSHYCDNIGRAHKSNHGESGCSRRADGQAREPVWVLVIPVK